MVLRGGGQQSHCVCIQETEREERWCSAHFLLFCSVWAPTAHEMVLTTFKVGLVSLVKTFWKELQSHSQRCVSMVILNAVKSTMEMERPILHLTCEHCS